MIYTPMDDDHEYNGAFHDIKSFRDELGLGPDDISDQEIARVMMQDAQEQARIARQQSDRARHAEQNRPVAHTLRVETPGYYFTPRPPSYTLPTNTQLAYELELARERERRREAEEWARIVARDPSRSVRRSTDYDNIAAAPSRSARKKKTRALSKRRTAAKRKGLSTRMKRKAKK
jgi:hypothetical protein